MFDNRPDRPRELATGHRGSWAALGGGAVIAVVTLSIATAAGATPDAATPPTPTPSQIATAHHDCDDLLRNVHGNPKIVDNKDGLYVSLWPTQVTCIVSGLGNGAATVNAPSKPLVPGSIQRLSGAIDLCKSNCSQQVTPSSTSTTDSTTGRRVVVDATFLDGVVGRDVAGVTVHLTNRQSVKAIIENGHYLAWWDNHDLTVIGTKATVSLQNGKTSSVPVPPLLHAEFCAQQVQQGASVCLNPVDEN